MCAVKLKKNDFIFIPGNYDGGDYARITEKVVGDIAQIEWYWDDALRTSTVNISEDTYERVSDDTNGWLRRTYRKGPFKLYGTRINQDNTRSYTILFKDRGKVRIGAISDGQYARYGISTFGALSFPKVGGLWQSNVGAVSDHQLDLMIQFWNNECDLPDWSVTQLKNLRW